MEIRIGQYCNNRTRKYLLPALILHGKEFERMFNSVCKLGIGIYDNLMDGGKHENKDNPYIYILFDSKYNPRNFERFLDWIRYEDYYIDDYSLDSDVTRGRKIMVILKFPQQLKSSITKFKEGKYSEMYSEEFVLENFKNQDTINVLLKNPKGIDNFLQKVDKEYGTNSKKSDFVNSELDFPISINTHTEIFNYELNRGVT